MWLNRSQKKPVSSPPPPPPPLPKKKPFRKYVAGNLGRIQLRLKLYNPSYETIHWSSWAVSNNIKVLKTAEAGWCRHRMSNHVQYFVYIEVTLPQRTTTIVLSSCCFGAVEISVLSSSLTTLLKRQHIDNKSQFCQNIIEIYNLLFSKNANYNILPRAISYTTSSEWKILAS